MLAAHNLSRTRGDLAAALDLPARYASLARMHAALADAARMGATTAAAARSHRHTAWLAAAFAVDLVLWGIAIWKGRDVDRRKGVLLARVEAFASHRNQGVGLS